MLLEAPAAANNTSKAHCIGIVGGNRSLLVWVVQVYLFVGLASCSPASSPSFACVPGCVRLCDFFVTCAAEAVWCCVVGHTSYWLLVDS
eukprot:scaffold1827_cov117-Isochrysis_galbana.AAC.2